MIAELHATPSPGGVRRRRVDGDRHRRDRAFCTGADVSKASTSDQDDFVAWHRHAGRADARVDAAVGRAQRPPLRTCSMTKPIVCAVNGMCGRWLDLVTTCDIAIASEDASFFDPHVSIGVVSGREMARARLVPLNIAMRMALMGKHDRMSAERAFDLGLVSELVAPEDLVKRAWGSRADQRARRWRCWHSHVDPQGPRAADLRSRAARRTTA